ncbi:hypothetical protein ACFE04_007080 [Oxalis oulophora]
MQTRHLKPFPGRRRSSRTRAQYSSLRVVKSVLNNKEWSSINDSGATEPARCLGCRITVPYSILFEKVEVEKPAASRSESAEIYVLGLKYKAPARIDPRLLDVKHLFQVAIEAPKVVDVLRENKQKRCRDGIWNAAGSDGRIGMPEAGFLKLTHDKQGFERTSVLARLESRLK